MDRPARSDDGEAPAAVPPPADDPFKRIADEIEDHLACAAERHIAAGLDLDHARRQALAEFGDPKRVAAELALIAQGDLAMNRKLTFAVVAALALGLAVSAYFGYRSTRVMSDQMRLMQEQMTTMADALRNAPTAAPQPYGRILIRARRADKPVPGVTFRIEGNKGGVSKEFRTDAHGNIDSSFLPFDEYRILLTWPPSGESQPDWSGTWRDTVRIYQPGEEFVRQFDLPPPGTFTLRVSPPPGCTLIGPSFAHATVYFSQDTATGIGYFHASASVAVGENAAVPNLPSGQHRVSVAYVGKQDGGLFGQVSIGTVERTVNFPVDGGVLDLTPKLSKPPITGHVFNRSRENGVPGVKLSLNSAICVTDEHGYFGLPILSSPFGGLGMPAQSRDRDGAGGSHPHDRSTSAEMGVTRENGDMYTYRVALSPSSANDIDLSQLAYLTVRAGDMPAEPVPGMFFDHIEVQIVMRRPPARSASPIDTPAILRRSVTLPVPTDRERERMILPSGYLKIDSEIKAFLTVVNFENNDTLQVKLRLDHAPPLRGGETTDWVITEKDLMKILLSGQEVGSPGVVSTLRNWRMKYRKEMQAVDEQP
ncbi:MAG: permease prefix domain 1-containing protein [Phycisphaerae bacterium]